MKQEQKFNVLETQDVQSTHNPGDPSSLPLGEEGAGPQSTHNPGDLSPLPLGEEGAGPTASLEVQNEVGPNMQKVRPQLPWLQAIHAGQKGEIPRGGFG